MQRLVSRLVAPPLSARAALPLALPQRWCTSSSSSTGTPPPTSLGAPLHAPSSFSSSPEDTLAAQLRSLSPEDRKIITEALSNPGGQKSSRMGGGGIGPAEGEMVAAFTCGPCDYRMVKRFSKHAYTKGIVIVECPNCRAKHLLADNLGWLEDEAVNIEEILKERGEAFTRIGGTEGDYQVTGEEVPPPSPSL